jgi:hypothetical protein
MTRIRPSNRRLGETLAVEFAQLRYAVTVGYLSDHKSPIEIFVSAEKTASAIEPLARDAAILMSFAMQFGASVADLRAAVSRGDRGEPASLVGAVLDAVAALGEA